MSPKRPIVRVERLTVREIAPARRSELTRALCPIFEHYYEGLGRDIIENGVVFRRPSARLGVCYGPAGEVAGYVTTNIEVVKVSGEEHALFSGGAYFLPGYRGTLPGMRFGLAEAVRFRARHPRTPLSYVAEALTPASYAALLGAVAVAYPRADAPTPKASADLLRAVGELWGVRFARPDGLVGQYAPPVFLKNADALRSSKRLSANEHARFFTQINPNFATDGFLLVHVPVHVPNLFSVVLPRAHAAIRRWTSGTELPAP